MQRPGVYTACISNAGLTLIKLPLTITLSYTLSCGGWNRTSVEQAYETRQWTSTLPAISPATIQPAGDKS